jgi:hypothetical protein
MEFSCANFVVPPKGEAHVSLNASLGVDMNDLLDTTVEGIVRCICFSLSVSSDTYPVWSSYSMTGAVPLSLAFRTFGRYDDLSMG